MTDLVLASQDSAVAQYVPPPDVLSGFVRIRPSNISLVQYTTRTENVTPGKFRDSITGDEYDSLTVVPLTLHKSRVLFPPGNDFTAKPLCRSNDAVVPSPFALFPQASSCGKCTKALWGRDNGRPVKPECAEGFNMLILDKNTLLPAYMKFSGSAFKPFKDFLEKIERDRYKVAALGGQKPSLFDYFFTIKSQQLTSQRGKYFIPLFTEVKRVENAGQFGPFYQQFGIEAAKYLDNDEVVDDADATIESATSGVSEAQFVDA